MKRMKQFPKGGSGHLLAIVVFEDYWKVSNLAILFGYLYRMNPPLPRLCLIRGAHILIRLCDKIRLTFISLILYAA
jgi:hypothetical protein